MVYTYVFTLAAGGITVTWNARPAKVSVGARPIVVERIIPGNDHTILQMLGSKSKKFMFEGIIYNLVLIPATGAAEPRDVLQIIDDWAEAGTLVTFVYDYVTEAMGEAAGIPCLITDFQWDEIDGTEETYPFKITLIRYVGANP